MQYICHELIDRFSIAVIKHFLVELADSKRTQEFSTVAELIVEQEAIRRNLIAILSSVRNETSAMPIGKWLADLAETTVRLRFNEKCCDPDRPIVSSINRQTEEANLQGLLKMAGDPWGEELAKLTTRLAEVNLDIANLERLLRRGGESNMSVQEIAKCAIAVRNANNGRLELKNQLRLLIDPELNECSFRQ
jgi:hypothetical protein